MNLKYLRIAKTMRIAIDNKNLMQFEQARSDLEFAREMGDITYDEYYAALNKALFH